MNVEYTLEEGLTVARWIGDHASELVTARGKGGLHDDDNVIVILFDRQIRR